MNTWMRRLATMAVSTALASSTALGVGSAPSVAAGVTTAESAITITSSDGCKDDFDMGKAAGYQAGQADWDAGNWNDEGTAYANSACPSADLVPNYADGFWSGYYSGYNDACLRDQGFNCASW
jgi:phosphate-selective porin